MFRKSAVTAILAVFLAACASTGDDREKTKKGAAVGAAAGAVAGAVIGNQSGNPRTGAAVGAVVGAGVGAAVGARMDRQQRELEQIEGIEVERTAEDELNVSLRNEILFDYNSSALRAQSRRTLTDMGSVFERYPDTTIVVEGHADSIGPDDYNQRLSEQRAASVKNFLIDQGVRASRIVARGFGESQPVASNSTPEGRQLNRRVEINVKANPEVTE